jgi:probable phosphoglycerate mutase
MEISNSWLNDRDFTRRFEGGESFLDMRKRFVPFVEQVIRDHKHPNENVVLLGHGGLFRCMLPVVLKNIEVNAQVTRSIGYTTAIVAETCDDGLICRAWGHTSFEAP